MLQLEEEEYMQNVLLPLFLVNLQKPTEREIEETSQLYISEVYSFTEYPAHISKIMHLE